MSEEVPIITENLLWPTFCAVSRSSPFVLVIASPFLFAWINEEPLHGER